MENLISKIEEYFENRSKRKHIESLVGHNLNQTEVGWRTSIYNWYQPQNRSTVTSFRTIMKWWSSYMHGGYEPSGKQPSYHNLCLLVIYSGIYIYHIESWFFNFVILLRYLCMHVFRQKQIEKNLYDFDYERPKYSTWCLLRVYVWRLISEVQLISSIFSLWRKSDSIHIKVKF